MTRRDLLARKACAGAFWAARDSAYALGVSALMQTSPLDSTAREYVRLALALGEHDKLYVDAYYGPEPWRQEAVQLALPPAAIAERARAAAETARGGDGAEDILSLRRRFLARQLESLAARADFVAGRRFSFDEESRLLYDATAPSLPEAHFRNLLGELESQVPGTGPLPERFQRFNDSLAVPSARLDAAFRRAIEESRRRTTRFIRLPKAESFQVEYVRGQSWSAYNWYKGALRSVIQLNTDFPIHPDRLLHLASHEGYPGHHVYNVLLESKLSRGRGWVEFLVYPLYSPQSLIAEGSAEYGFELAFPAPQRLEFHQRVLFPLAGLDAARSRDYVRVQELSERLSDSGNEAARAYLDGTMNAAAAIEWLVTYALMTPERARQRLRFIEQHRSYVINYNLGRDLVRRYVERTAGATHRRWAVFENLLSTPRTPSGLADGLRDPCC